MRTAYHEQLDALNNQLAEMCRMAGIAMERATQALLQADLVEDLGKKDVWSGSWAAAAMPVPA